jgi:beta-lactamase superfamily II metal-dependent hydrolase
MKNNGKLKLSKGKLTAIIIAVAVVLLSAVFAVINIFVPLKYLTAYFTVAHKNSEGQLVVTAIDVGFGSCTIVSLPDGKTMVIDGGDGEYENNFNIIKYLNANGINEIDYLICSSVKSEHCGGLTEILKYKKVKQAYIPYCKNTRVTDEYHSFLTQLNQSEVPYSYSGVGIGGEGEEYDYFWTFISPSDYRNPNSEYADLNSDNSSDNINNSSAVIWLEYMGEAFLFCSDAGSTALQNIYESYELTKEIEQPFCSFGSHSVNLEKCTVVFVAGHGGKSNTYALFYDILSPNSAIISVGKNYAGYPSLAALADIANSCDDIQLTQEQGDIKFIVK